MRDQAIEHGIGGGVHSTAGGTGPSEPMTEPIGPLGPPPSASPNEPRGWPDALRNHLAFALVLIVAAVGIALIVLYHWRRGALLMGAALLLAALFRALLPDRRAGLLVVRGRPVDVLSYAVLGICMMSVAVTITGGPFG